jgi:hypothetical protein
MKQEHNKAISNNHCRVSKQYYVGDRRKFEGALAEAVANFRPLTTSLCEGHVFTTATKVDHKSSFY